MRRATLVLYLVVTALAAIFLLFVVSQPSKEDFDKQIESYLLNNPGILEKMVSSLQEKREQEERLRIGEALKQNFDLIYNDEDNIILGNPNGDVTLVEFFDYNCPYCKQVMPHIPELLDNDDNLKIILKEFPILGQDSIEAARLSIAVHRLGGDYWEFHEALFSGRDRVNVEKALKVALEMGIDIEKLQEEAKKPEIDDIINKSYIIAQNLGINGTPAFIIGDEILPGAVDVEELQFRIENMRLCGKAICAE